MSLFMEDSYVRLDEILLIGLGDIDELLRVEVIQGEPSTLNLNHDSMAFLEAMRNVWQGKLHLRHFSWFKGFWVFKAIAISASHYLATNQHLIATHDCR